jgi:O-antigen ligase
MPSGSSPRPALALCGLAVGLAVSLAPPGRVVLVILGVAILGALPLAVGPLREAVTNRFGTGSEDRAAEWSESWKLFTKSPMFGVGPGRYELRYTEGGDAKVARYAHNEYLQIATELGAVGLGVTVVALFAVWNSVHHANPEYCAALLASAAAAALDFTWHFPLIVLMSAVIVGLAVAPEPPTEVDLQR